MKIFILAAKEGWITDVLEREWIEGNSNLYTTNIKEADIIWVLSNYIIRNMPLTILMKKKVITTIHHMVPEKMTQSLINHYKYLDKVTNIFHVICENTYSQLKDYVTKPIKTKLFWTNLQTWCPLFKNDEDKINTKYELRNTFNIDQNKFIIGSFQKDTEGASIANKTYLPKLEKGPDQFIDIVKKMKMDMGLNMNMGSLEIVLTGYGRQYLMRELDTLGIKYHYFEMISQSEMNKLYQCLDIYIVASRYEGGPRSIHECAANKTPIISTNVGVASDILAPESIFKMDEILGENQVVPNTEYAYNNILLYSIPEYFKEFNTIFDSV